MVTVHHVFRSTRAVLGFFFCLGTFVGLAHAGSSTDYGESRLTARMIRDIISGNPPSQEGWALTKIKIEEEDLQTAAPTGKTGATCVYTGSTTKGWLAICKNDKDVYSMLFGKDGKLRESQASGRLRPGCGQHILVKLEDSNKKEERLTLSVCMEKVDRKDGANALYRLHTQENDIKTRTRVEEMADSIAKGSILSSIGVCDERGEPKSLLAGCWLLPSNPPSDLLQRLQSTDQTE